ncbi:hypothetical protein [Nocardioides astragali]|uniref:SMC-Scp complex subunit ScpB n=1 Tax=Nocardioides astragali TaxID=1776736 RepID=A0ABW2N0X8_9ACTN|nr:hypothetical protein [Nocardioides astragali]
MINQFDFGLVDEALLEEVQLTTALIVAAGESEGPLSRSEIDRILGVTPGPGSQSGDVQQESPDDPH